jgi:hypothetical protein
MIATSGSLNDASGLLGISISRGKTAVNSIGPWFRDKTNASAFYDSLNALADDLDARPTLINYGNRRQRLAHWTLPPEDLQPLIQLADSAAPAPPERHRRLASWIVWTRVTGGEPTFAPPTILPATASKTRTALINNRHNLTNDRYQLHLANYAQQLAHDIDADPQN